MSVDLPKIKFHILWAKDYFLSQGLEGTTLFLSFPLPCPAPGSRYCSFPDKGSTKTNPPSLPDSPSAHSGLHVRVCTESKRSPGFCQNPSYLKTGGGRAGSQTQLTVPTAPGPVAQIPRGAALPGIARNVPGHMQCGHRSVPGTYGYGDTGHKS